MIASRTGFTDNHLFWIAGPLLALVPLPDFTTPLRSMAGSLRRIAAAAEPAVRPAPPAPEALLPASDQPIEPPAARTGA
jgi:hypothetical protein